MSKASREWKKTCKNDNRLTNGTSWSKKDMTLSSYKAIKRYDRRFYKRANMRHLIKGLKELEAKEGIKTVWVDHDGIGNPVILEDGDMKSEITVFIGS